MSGFQGLPGFPLPIVKANALPGPTPSDVASGTLMFLVQVGSPGSARLMTGAQLLAYVGAGGTTIPAAQIVALLQNGLLSVPTGIVTGATRHTNTDQSSSYAYTSDIDGTPLPYTSRGDGVGGPAQILNTTGRLLVIIADGASAQTTSINIAGDLAARQARLAGLVAAGNGSTPLASAVQQQITLLTAMQQVQQRRRVFKFCDSAHNVLPQQQIAQPTTNDLIGCDANTPYSPLSMWFCHMIQAFAKRDGLQQEPIALVCPAQAGAAISDLLPTGAKSWNSLLSQLAFLATYAVKYGLSLHFGDVYLITDCGIATPVGAFTPQIQQFQAAITALNLNSGTDGSQPVLYLDQSPPDTTHTYSFPAAADQLAYATGVCLGGRGWASLQDQHHEDSVGLIEVACGHAYARQLNQQSLWGGPLRIATQTGSTTNRAIYITPNGVGGANFAVDFSEPIIGGYTPLVLDGNLAVTGLDAQWGLRLLQAAGTFLTISGLTISAGTSRVTGTISALPSVGDTFSNARYGGVGTAGGAAGVFPNLRKRLTDSPIAPGQGIDVSAWACQEEITLTSANFAAAPVLPAIISIALSPSTLQSGQSGTSIVGTLTAITQGTTGAIVWTIGDTSGLVSIVSGNQVQAVANVPNDGNLQITATATPAAGAPLTVNLTITVS